jgi:diguanylate cyclase (GGDEF)-like protein/PAS domain S-box-containing protein
MVMFYQVQLVIWSFALEKTPLLALNKIYSAWVIRPGLPYTFMSNPQHTSASLLTKTQSPNADAEVLAGKVLIIDQDAQDNSLLCKALAESHYNFCCTNSVEKALQSLLTYQPDVVLLNIANIEPLSLNICQQIISRVFPQAIPLIMISRSHNSRDKAKAFEVGCADHISKPFEMTELLIRLDNQLTFQATRKQVDQLNKELEQRVLERTLQLQTVHQRLKASEERLESILNALQDVVWSAAIEPFQILYLNPASAGLFQRPAEDFLINSELWFSTIHPEDRSEVLEQMSTITQRGSLDLEYRICWPSGDIRWVRNRSRVVVTNNDAFSIRIEGIVTDISDRKRAEKQLIHDALHDGLTQLPNRTLFTERLESALKRKQRRPEYQFAVLFLDLNRFKVINDSLGHTMGDCLLIEVSNRLLQCIRSVDTVARLGGDEFTILLEDIADNIDVIACVERIQTALGDPFEVKGSTVFTGCSIGIVIANPDYTAASELLRDADIAMYRAKENRKPGYEMFDQTMYAQTRRRLQLENDLRLSIEREEFQLHYQPIISLKDYSVLGFEALVRWTHPLEQMIFPGEFITIAEETGMIVPLGTWILKQACRQIRQWQKSHDHLCHLKININVTGQQFREPGLPILLDTLLNETGLEAQYLRLELTESTLIQDTEGIIDTLQQIRDRNIQISIDDFGTGYSSLSYLSRFPINNLKIDKSFVGRMHHDNDSFEIVRTITALAHTLGMDVTAEGIEHREQIEQLANLGCEFGQGYYFAPPLSPELAEKFLQEWQPGHL